LAEIITGVIKFFMPSSFMLYVINYMADKNSNILKKLIPHTANIVKTAFDGLPK
jgi:hypothetical protein